MKRVVILLSAVLFSGCSRTACELAIDSLQPAAKIPKTATIEIADQIRADDGGNTILKNYVIMSKQQSEIIDACQPKK